MTWLGWIRSAMAGGGDEADCDDDGNYDDYEENENPLVI